MEVEAWSVQGRERLTEGSLVPPIQTEVQVPPVFAQWTSMLT